MDAFWTDAERALRRAAADHFRRLEDPADPEADEPLNALRRRLEAGVVDPVGADPAPPAFRELGGHVSIVEEAASRDPRLAQRLLARRPAAVPLDPLEETLLRWGRLAGTAAHVVEAGARAARERGAFSSSLMGCREVQESLAGLVAGADLVRLGACRLCRLLERGQRERAVLESERLDVRALELAEEVRAVAAALLGESWVQATLDADGGPSADERTR